MTLEEIKELSGMGFTNDQIMVLAGTKDQNSTIPEPVPEPEPEPEPMPEKTEPEEKNTEVDLRIEQMQTQINNLIKQMQNNNLRTASVNLMPEDDLQKKTDEAMAELIRPKIKEVEK